MNFSGEMKDSLKTFLNSLTKANDPLDLRPQFFPGRRLKDGLNHQSFCDHSRNFAQVNSKF